MVTFWILLSHDGSASVLVKRVLERNDLMALGFTIAEEAAFDHARDPDAAALAWFTAWASTNIVPSVGVSP